MNWILDADIRGFFDNMSHEWTIKFIEHRVADRRILRLIRNGSRREYRRTASGWRQRRYASGAVVSPLIANVYLHYTFDLWADVWRRKVAKVDVIIVRYAEDLVMGFQQRADAVRFLEALVTALFSSIGKTLIGLYLGKSSVASAYGAAGSVRIRGHCLGLLLCPDFLFWR